MIVWFFDIGFHTDGHFSNGPGLGVFWNSTGREFRLWQAGVGRRLLQNRPSQLNGESEYALAA
jgi:predicted acetyltransferase